MKSKLGVDLCHPLLYFPGIRFKAVTDLLLKVWCAWWRD